MSVGTQTSPSAATKHIPAWKRIGLKLKYAKDTWDENVNVLSSAETAAVNASPTAVNETSSNKRSREASEEFNSVKKRKTSAERSQEDTTRTSKATLPPATTQTVLPTLIIAGADFGKPIALQPAGAKHTKFATEEDEKPALTSEESHSGQSADSRPRKKSVSFAAETKEEDGVGALEASKASTPGEATSITAFEQSEHDPNPGTVTSPSKKLKQPSKPKTKETADKKQKRKHKPVDESAPPYVQYLVQYHEDRESWKFSKSKQIDLIKNIWNIFRISPEHNEALVEYVRGLQGAAARQRLVEGADSVLESVAEAEGVSTDSADMDSSQARRAAYTGALKRRIERFEAAGGSESEYDKQQLDNMRQEIEKGRRAETLLREALLKELSNDALPKAAETDASQVSDGPVSHANGTTKPVKTLKEMTSKRKKRKSRTEVSSDESSSSSDSDSSPGPRSVHQALSVKPAPKARRADGMPLKVAAPSKDKIFDDGLLDTMSPKKVTYNETAQKRSGIDKSKARGFAYTHGTREDESGSEDE